MFTIKHYKEEPEKFKYLPVKLLVNIFEYLNVFDRLVAGLACKTWYEVSNVPKFLDAISILIHSPEDRRSMFSVHAGRYSPCALEEFSKCSRKFCNFKFAEQLDLDVANAKPFWESCAQNLKVLTFHNCKITSKSLCNVIKNSPQLTTLEMVMLERHITDAWCSDDFEALKGHNKITNFKWIDAHSFIKEDLFVALTSAFDGLEVLLLTSNPVDWNSFEYRMRSMPFEECIRDNSSTRSQDQLKITSLIKVLKKHSTTLKELQLDESKNINYRYISGMVAAKLPLDLQKLELQNCTSLKNIGKLNDFLKPQKNLKDLILKHVPVDQQTFETICSLTQLEKCNVWPPVGSKNFDLVMREIKNLRKLKDLGLFGIPSIKNQSFEMGVMQLDLGRLERFALFNVPYVKAETVGKALKQMCNLKILHLSDTPHVTTDENLQIVFEHCTRIELLELAGSENITERGFVNTFRISRLTNLNKFSFNNLKNLTDDCLNDINSKVLRSIELRQCDKVTIKGVATLIKQCPGLASVMAPNQEILDQAMYVGVLCMKRGFNFRVAD